MAAILPSLYKLVYKLPSTTSPRGKRLWVYVIIRLVYLIPFSGPQRISLAKFSMFFAYTIVNSTKEEYWCWESIFCCDYRRKWQAQISVTTIFLRLFLRQYLHTHIHKHTLCSLYVRQCTDKSHCILNYIYTKILIKAIVLWNFQRIRTDRQLKVTLN